MEIKTIQIGIAAESVQDAEILSSFCTNILKENGLKIQLRKGNIYSNNTKIIEDDFVKISNFFKSKTKHRPRIIIIATDRDGDKKTKSRLDVKIKETNFLQKVILVVHEEVIESWLLQCTSAINTVLNPDRKFQKAGKMQLANAKDALADVFGQSERNGKFLGTEAEAKIKIAQSARGSEIDSTDYSDFKRELLSAAKIVRSENIFEKKKPVKLKRIIQKRPKIIKKKKLKIRLDSTKIKPKNKKLPWSVIRKIIKRRKQKRKGVKNKNGNKRPER